MSKSVAQPLSFSMAVPQTFDIQPSQDRNDLAQSLQFTPGTAYLYFEIKPALTIPQD